MVFICIVMLLFISILPFLPHQAEALQVNPNVLQNESFEQTTNGIPNHWTAVGGWGGTAVTLSPQAARTGLAGVNVQSGSYANPWVYQVIPVEAGNTYDFSTWFKSSGVQGKGVVMKVEFYKNTQLGIANWVDEVFGPYVKNVTGDWQSYQMRLRAPEQSAYAVVFLRLWGTGSVMFDDAAVRLVNLTMTTDQINYYTDQTQAKVQLGMRFTDDDYSGKTVNIRISEAESGTVVNSAYGLSAQPELVYTFDPSVMTPSIAYKVEASLIGPDQTLWDEESSLIYRWARPTTLPPGGIIQSDGQPFFPVIAYHANVDQYALLKQIGINTVQGPQASSIADIHSALDAAHANGLKVLFPLYYYVNITNDYVKLEQYVNEFKNDPALLGWMAIDEPSGNGVSVEQVSNVYAIVRALDPTHPVYTLEGDHRQYVNYARVPDIFAVDTYPLPNRPITMVGDQVREAVAAVQGSKPVWSILQTFAYPAPSSWTYLPTITEVRNMAYQSLLAGATGVGYYSINDPGWSLPASDLWPGLVEFKPELELIGELAQSTPISKSRADGTEWAIWNNGTNGEMYVIALNDTTQNKSLSVPLPITGYHAELMYGDLPSSFNDPTDQLHVELGAYETLVYKLTPFAFTADKAASELGEAQSVSAQPHWTNKTTELIEGLQDVVDMLNSSTPNIENVTSDVASLIDQAQSLMAWVEKHPTQSLGGDRTALVAALQQFIDHIRKIPGALIGIELQIGSGGTVLSGEPSQINVTLKNRGDYPLTNTTVTIQFPDSLQLAPITETIGTLNASGTYSSTHSFTIPIDAGEAVYDVKGVVDFVYGNVELENQSTNSFRTIPLMAIQLNPNSITLSGSENVPFQIQLVNRANHAITAELLPQISSLIGVNIPASVTIGAGGNETVQGSVYLNQGSVANGSYPLKIQASVGTLTFDSLPLMVEVSRNLVPNPGFETAAGNGTSANNWFGSAGFWDSVVVHQGLRSMRLSPSSTNGNNFVYSAPISLATNRSYTLSGWTKHGSTAGQVLLGIRYTNATGATISYQWLTVPSSANWTCRELPLVVPAGTVNAYVQFRVNQTVNAQAWLDDLSLVENLTP
jgi:hypothetical protein